MAGIEKVIFMNMCMVYDKEGNVVALDKVGKNYSGTTFPGGHVEPGETFKEGEVLGKICDYFGRELFVYRAKMGGIILYQTISLCIMKDTPMVSYGTWDEEKQGKIELGCEVCGNKKHKHGHHHHKHGSDKHRNNKHENDKHHK